MVGRPLPPTLPMPTLYGTSPQAPLLLVDGHNLLWGATFGFPAPIYSRDKTRLLTGLFAFFALLRVGIRDDVPGAAPEIVVVFDGEHGAAGRQQAHDGYKASRPTDDQALLPLKFLHVGIRRHRHDDCRRAVKQAAVQRVVPTSEMAVSGAGAMPGDNYLGRGSKQYREQCCPRVW